MPRLPKRPGTPPLTSSSSQSPPPPPPESSASSAPLTVLDPVPIVDPEDTHPDNSNNHEPYRDDPDGPVDTEGGQTEFPLLPPISILSAPHLIFYLPTWLFQFLICFIFAIWMSVQFALMRDQRDPQLLDTIPVFILILVAVAIMTVITAEAIMFVRRRLTPQAAHKCQLYKLGFSLFGWLNLFLAALLNDPKESSSHVRATEVLVGIAGVLLLQLPWALSCAYSFFFFSRRPRTYIDLSRTATNEQTPAWATRSKLSFWNPLPLLNRFFRTAPNPISLEESPFGER